MPPRGRQDLAAISESRWWELYWSPESGIPSCAELGRHLGAGPGTIRYWLRFRGLRTRTRGEQLAADYRHGRKTPPPGAPPPKGLRPPNLKAPPRRPREWVERQAESQRRQVTAPCSWCGARVTRHAAAMKGPRQYCNRQHSSRHIAHRRWQPELPRPLIVAQLRRRLDPGPMTYDRAERLGREIGATEAEMVEALQSE